MSRKLLYRNPYTQTGVNWCLGRRSLPDENILPVNWGTFVSIFFTITLTVKQVETLYQKYGMYALRNGGEIGT